MKKDTERLEFMSKQLSVLDIPFAIQEGIDGKTYDFQKIYDESLAIKLNGAELTPGEKGCLLSHRLIWEKVVKENIAYALILEDDIELTPDFKNILDREIKNRQENKTIWEYLSFNYPTPGIKFIKLWVSLIIMQFSEKSSLKQWLMIPLYAIKFLFISIVSVFEGIRETLYKNAKWGKPLLFYRPIYLAGCYVLTTVGAKKLLDINEKLVYTADRIQNIARKQNDLKVFWYVPLQAKQRRDKFHSSMYEGRDYNFKKYG